MEAVKEATLENYHTMIPWRFPQLYSPCSKVLIFHHLQPLESHGSKEPRSWWLFKNMPPRQAFPFLHPCCFPPMGMLSTSFLLPILSPPSLALLYVDVFLLSVKTVVFGPTAENFLWSTHNLISHCHQVLSNEKKKNRCSTVRSWPCSPIRHHTHFCKVTLTPWWNETEQSHYMILPKHKGKVTVPKYSTFPPFLPKMSNC